MLSQLHGIPPELRQVPTARPVIAIGVNVVWGTPHVLPIADALRAAGAGATFFLGGRWAEQHAEIARGLVQRGMEIGSHGDAHRHVAALDEAENEREITLAAEKIARATGVRPRLYAPAYGELSPAVQRAAARQGVRVVLWSIDTIDWRPSHTPEIIRERVLRRLQPGAIVLMHPTDRTLAALPALLAELKARGYRVVSVGDLLREAGAVSPGGEQVGMGRQRVLA